MTPDLTENLHHQLDAFRQTYLGSEDARNLFKVVFPIALFGLYLASIPLLFPSTWEQFVGFIVAYVVPPAGKESIIPAAIGAGFPALAVVFYIAAMDAIVGLWIVWNWDLAKEVPGLRWVVQKAQESGEEFLEEREWMEDFAFVSLFVFVMIPFQGSGAIAGSFVGRAISVPADRVWYAIAGGAFVGSLTIGVLGQSIIYAFHQALGTGIAMVVGFVVVAAAGAFLYLQGGNSDPPYAR